MTVSVYLTLTYLPTDSTIAGGRHAWGFFLGPSDTELGLLSCWYHTVDFTPEPFSAQVSLRVPPLCWKLTGNKYTYTGNQMSHQ